MNVYKRIKQLLLEVSSRTNPSVMASISGKHARKANSEKNFDLKSPDRKLAKKYGKKREKIVGDLTPSLKAGSRMPGSKYITGSYHGT